MSVTICFLNKHNTKNNNFRLHSHDCYEVVYFLTGSGKTIIGDKTYPVKEKCFCIVAPGTRHIECIDGYGEIMFVGFEYDGKGPAPEQGVYNEVELESYSLLNGVFEEYREQKRGYESASEAMLTLFLTGAMRGGNSISDSERCKDIDHIKEYIREHSEQKISFKELASVSGYSRDYFRHIFRKRFGMSPQEYLICVRLEKAAKLLEKTDYSCTDVAYMCGFSNSAQLSTMFKKRYGVTPAQYKMSDLYKNNRL